MASNQRLQRALAVGGVVLALAFAVPRVASHMPYARLGLSIAWTPQGNARVEEIVGPPAKGLLKTGDMILTVNGERLTRPSRGDGRLAMPKEAITVEVLRAGSRLTMTVPPMRLSLWQRVRFLLFRLAALVAAPLVAFALMWRRPDLGTARVFLWFAALQGIAVVFQIYRNPEVEPTGWLRQWMGLYGWIVCWTPAAFLHFLAVFPRPRWKPDQRLRSTWFWLVAISYLVPIYFVMQWVTDGKLSQSQFMIFESAALVLGVGSLVARYAGPRRPEWQPARSHRVLGLLVCALLVIGGALSWVFESGRGDVWLQFPAVRLIVTVVGIGMLLTPFALAYLMVRDPVFDPRRILERTIPYALLSGVLAAVYLSVVFGGQRLFAAMTGEETMVFSVVAALILAFAFAPLKERVQRVLDRLFRRDPLALRVALDQAGRELLGALDRDEVRASVEAGLTRGLGRGVTLDWRDGAPALPGDVELPDHARGAVENLFFQARIRLENLALQEQRAAAERRALALREAAIQAELRALHAQVQPHFLFNALNALSYLTEVDPKAAQRFTERLADMLRYTVQATDRQAVPLSDEIGFVEDYLGVARERYEGDLQFVFRGSNDLLSAAVPPLLLQPLVENSLKHGFSTERRSLRLALDGEAKDGWLTLVFQDDGCNGANGANGGANGKRGLGVGLENLEQRLRYFAGPDASMVAGPGEGGGFRVTMRWREGAGAAGAA